MIESTEHRDVFAHRLSWWRSRTIGYAVHVYEVRGVLIDTGFPAVAADVHRVAESRRVRGAMVTHQHEDHAGNVEMLALMGVPLAIGAETVRLVSAPNRIGLYRHILWQSMPVLRSPVQPFVDDSLEFVHTPGHSHDHHAVWDHETRTLFAGDLYLGVKVRTAHPHESPRAQVASLRAMIARGPRRLFCGHRGLVSDPMGALSAKADWMDGIITGIERLHGEGHSIVAIRRQLLGARGRVHWISGGDYSPDNVITAVIRDAGVGGGTREQGNRG